MRTTIEENGRVSVTTGDSTWTCRTPEQAAKHVPTWTDARRNVVPSETIAPGDATAIQDCAADYARMKREGGAAKPSRSWVYENGEAREIPRDVTPIVAPADNPVTASLARRLLDTLA
jgi:hypothetical protein